MTIIKFNDGVQINTAGPFRKLKLADGWYVVGQGFLIPVMDEKEADEEINQLKGEKKMNKEETEEFLDFLKSNQIQDEFILNLYKYNPALSTFDTMTANDFFKSTDPSRVLYDAFLWSKTIQGQLYWNMLTVEWMDFLHKKDAVIKIK